MNVGERIKKRREQLKLSADKVGEMIGKNRSTVYRYEANEIENMPYKIIEKLSKVLKVSPSYLMGWDDTPPEIPVSIYNYFPIGISAGLPINIEPIETVETITIPDELLGKYAGSKDIYFARINGESMNKVIPHRSLIAVKQIEVENLKNGDIVVYSNGNDYAVKRFYDFGDEIVFRPESTEPHFRDYSIKKENADELKLHGKVVTYIVNLD